jgi:hypothetical protein
MKLSASRLGTAEVERQQVGHRKALDLAMADLAKMLLDPVGGELFSKDLVELRGIGDHADVAAVAFVTGASVGDAREGDLHESDQTSFTVTSI